MSAARSASWSPDSLIGKTASFVRHEETEDHIEGPVANGHQRNYVREVEPTSSKAKPKRHHRKVNAQQDHADHVKVVLEQHVLSAEEPKQPPA